MLRAIASWIMLAALLGGLVPPAAAQSPFEVAVSPSRFELSGKPGGRVGQSLSIYNVGGNPTEVSIRTLDFDFAEDGQITYLDALSPGSCRPWVTLERRSLRVQPRARSSFRFQVEIPADAPRSECRFMVAIEGREPAYQVRMDGNQGAQLSMPVSGRIAVVVYLAINGAQPKLEVSRLGVVEAEGRRIPSIVVRNSGDAHGRLEGALEAVNARGEKFEMVPDGSPVMPGQTRVLLFQARADSARKTPELVLPLKATGQLEWAQGTFKIDSEFK